MEVDRGLIETLAIDADAEAVAEAAGLRYVHDDEPGLRRRVRGRGFSYVRADGRTAGDAERQRIEALAIPPAWTDVWICSRPDGHLLVTGLDDAGRKQYLYHPRWREVRDLQKFDRLSGFGGALIDLRRSVASDLRRRGLRVERVAAAVVRLIDSNLVRVGNERYAEDNDTFGVTTLQRKHVRSTRAGLTLCFNGKGGKAHRLVVDDPGVGRVIEACLEQRGPQLFCATVDGRPVPITAPLVNEYLHRIGGEHLTAKDFRTWGATAIATGVLGPLPEHAPGAAPDDPEHHVLAALDTAATALGNTRAVCRSSYVAPAVLAAYREGELGEDWRSSRSGRWRSRAEVTAAKTLDR
jgi:DNA topoisomerase-1